jgi:hypothetical protein
MTLTNGLVVMTPSSVDKTGTSSTATINSDGSVTCSLCETLSLNDVFTSEYDNYMVTLRHSPSTFTNWIYGRFRFNKTDNSTASSYVTQTLRAVGTNTSATTRDTLDWGYFYPSSENETSGSVIYFFGPYLTQPTAWRQISANGYVGASIFDTAGTHNQSVSYDGFSFLTGGYGLITGLLTVFGFNQ